LVAQKLDISTTPELAVQYEGKMHQFDAEGRKIALSLKDAK